VAIKMPCGSLTSQVRCDGCCGAEALMQFCLSASFFMQFYLASSRRKLYSQTKVLPNKPEQIAAFCYRFRRTWRLPLFWDGRQCSLV